MMPVFRRNGSPMMGQVKETDSLALGARLRGMRICLAHIREEALVLGQHDVAEYLYQACETLDCEIEMFDGDE